MQPLQHEHHCLGGGRGSGFTCVSSSHCSHSPVSTRASLALTPREEEAEEEEEEEEAQEREGGEQDTQSTSTGNSVRPAASHTLT